MANTVTIEVDANTRNAEKDIGGLGGKIKNLAKPIAIGSAAATGLAAAAVKIGDEFKEAENTIRAGTGASGKDLDALKDSFNEVFANVPNDSQEVATAIADLNTELGLTGEDLTSATTAFLNLSRTMGDDASGAIKSVSDSLVAFGEPATSVEEHLDKLTVASQAVGVPVSDLSSAVVKFAPQLKEMGLNLEESTALFANMEAAGLETSRMMPGLNTAMKKLTDAGVTDMSAGLSELIDDIKNAETDTESLALAQDAFGAGAGIRVKDAILSGAMEFDSLLEVMQNSEGTLATLGEETLTTSDKFDIMKNKVKGALEPVGSMATMAGPLIMIIPGITTAVSGLSAGMMALNISMGPVLIAIGAIALAIGAAILIWKNWDTIVEGSKKIWEGLKNTISSVFEGIWSVIKFYINLWIGAFNILIKGLNKVSFDVPDWVPGLGGKGFGFDIPEIPKLEDGGIVTGSTIAQIGEAGPEAVVPLSQYQGGQNTDILKQILAVLTKMSHQNAQQGAGGAMNMEFSGPTYGFDDFEDRVFMAIRDGARRGAFRGVLSTA